MAYMSTEIGTDVFEKENEEDETAKKFDEKKYFDMDVWKELSNNINEMVRACAYISKYQYRGCGCKKKIKEAFG